MILQQNSFVSVSSCNKAHKAPKRQLSRCSTADSGLFMNELLEILTVLLSFFSTSEQLLHSL